MSEPTTPAPRFTLRQLPLPAKLVVTLFMLTVGLGYSTAMVQLHFQHSRGDGQPMPTVDDVIAVYAGKTWTLPAGAEARPVSQLEKLVTGPVEGAPWNGTGSMAPAFFKKDGGEYARLTRNAKPDVVIRVDAEREGERRALQLWMMLPDDKRETAYDLDRFVFAQDDPIPEEITPEFADDPMDLAKGIKIRSILEARCVRCHAQDGEEPQYPLETYAHIAEYLEVPVAVEVPEGGGWVPSGRQLTEEKLAQSTHAHLLSFAMLFSLTGLVFAFTSYPAVVRGILGPLALLAQVADVACWWLARLPDSGPYFAMAILGTGGVVGLTLMAQIVLSVFNMYGYKGKAALLSLFVLGGFLAYVGYEKVAKPHLQSQREAAIRAQQEAEKDELGEPTDPTNGSLAVPPAPSPGPSRIERLLTGTFDPSDPDALNFGGKSEGGMVRAFFDRAEGPDDDDWEFAPALEDNTSDLPRLTAERTAEQKAMLAWVKADPQARKQAYDDDRFPLPPELAGQPLTAKFKADDATLKVKTLISNRCAFCHEPDGAAFDYPLTSYDGLEKYLQPEVPEPKAETGPKPIPTAE